MIDDPTSSAPRTPALVAPKALALKRAEQELRVTWQDGVETVFTAATLRKNCPCATCNEERSKQTRVLLPVLKQSGSGPLTLDDAKLVGTYAIQFIWSDGHTAGIFDYKYLRSLSAND